MSIKKIKFIVKPRQAHWVGDGFFVLNIIPTIYGAHMKDMDPFILLDYNALMKVPPSKEPLGVDVHPHRGFETVTIAYKGKVEHRDSSGGGGVIETGDVQWMTAAKGVLHKEFHEKNWSKLGGEFQMVQFWINLPAKFKMVEPAYQAISNNSLAKYQLSDNSGLIEVIAGEYMGIKGPAHTFTPIYLMNVKMKNGGNASFTFPASYNTAILVIEGSIEVDGQMAFVDHFVKFDNVGEDFTITAKSDEVIALVMSGEPINEPIAAHGPFVMNNEKELEQAIEDFNNGKFGTL